MTTASGSFEINNWDQDVYDEQPGAQLAKVRAGKTFHGDIEGSSTGDLLFVGVPDDAGEYQGKAYVGVERISGTVHGRKGDFVVIHTADMSVGMTVSIVGGSGSDELRGITGQLAITRAEDGTHTYTLEYDLG
jgi:hypothetical protein